MLDVVIVVVLSFRNVVFLFAASSRGVFIVPGSLVSLAVRRVILLGDLRFGGRR